MATRISTTSPGRRLQVGASVLSAARVTDTRPVKARLGRFDRAHRAYLGAQRRVDVTEAELRAAQTRLENVDAIQNKAVGALAGALIADGQPLGNAFAAFGAPSPGTITRLPFTEKAAAVHQLVAAIQRDERLAKATMEAGQAVEKAARAVEQALGPVAKMQQAVREARWKRDVRGQAWDDALAALRNDARAAAKDGTPQIYAALFAPVARAATKTKAPAEPAPTVTTTPPAEPAPAVTTTPPAAA